MFKPRFLVLVFVISSINNVFTRCIIEKSHKIFCSYVNLSDLNSVSDKNSATSLVIDHFDDKILPDKAFEFSNLQILKIAGKLRTLLSNSLKLVPNLQTLDLSHNRLRYIPNDLFANIPQLKDLTLSHNDFASPTLDTFYKTNKVEFLDLSHNFINDLILGVFDETNRLKRLYLNHNSLSSLELGVFDSLKNLTELDVSFNRITQLPLGIFDKSNRIQILKLVGNRLNELELGILDPLKKLQHLDVSSNRLDDLNLGVLDVSNDLKSFNIAGNNLKNVPLGMFDRNNKLKNVDLSSNRLENIEGALFDNNKLLGFVNMSHNLIKNIHFKTFKNTSLLNLDVSYNELKEIGLGVLNLRSLREFYARKNRISYLDVLTFSTDKSGLKTIDLRENRLVFVEDEFFDWLPKLKRFEIGGNPWDCQCLEEISRRLSIRQIAYDIKLYFDGNKPSCVVRNSGKCSVTKNETAEYYELYTKIY